MTFSGADSRTETVVAVLFATVSVDMMVILYLRILVFDRVVGYFVWQAIFWMPRRCSSAGDLDIVDRWGKGIRNPDWITPVRNLVSGALLSSRRCYCGEARGRSIRSVAEFGIVDILQPCSLERGSIPLNVYTNLLYSTRQSLA